MRQNTAKNVRRLILKGIQILFVILLLGTGLTVKAATTRTVRVAFFPMTGFNEYDSNGNRTGMDVEYLGALNEFADWNIEYVDCDSWDDALRMLSDGEADLVGSAQYSEERAKIYDYARFPSGYTFGAIMTDSENAYAYEDFEVMENLTFGMVRTYIRKEEFLEYLKDNGITNPVIKEYDSSAELRAAQEKGEVDAIVHTYMEMDEGQQIIGRFAPSPFYYISGKGNSQLMEELNQAISSLLMSNPTLENTLLDKYYSSKLHQSLTLTTQEKEYVQTLDTLVIGYVDGYYPFSYEENGELCGLTREIFDVLNTNTGIHLSYQKAKSMEEALQMLEDGAIDVLSYCIENPYTLSELQLKQAAVYSSAPQEELLGTQKWSENVLKEIEPDQTECDVAAAVRSDVDTELTGILNKSLEYIDYKKLNEYIRLHPLTVKFELSQWILEHEMLIAIWVLIVVSIILLVVSKMLFDSRKMQHLLYRDTEVDAWNMNYLTYTGERLIASSKSPYAIVYINVMQFRMYSSLYGWQAGNTIIRKMAEFLNENIDEDCEICARNQGDRFILMLSVASSEEFTRRIQQLKRQLEGRLFRASGIHMVVCMGVYYMKPGETDVKSATAMASQALEFLQESSESRIQVYDEKLDEEMRKQHEKEELLERVDINKDFTVYYQEKVDIRTQKIIGAEALVRFVNPFDDGQVFSPGFFVPYYEKTGKIKQLDFFVLETTCRMLRRRMDCGETVVPVSCNFSRRHFEEKDFPEKLEAVLEKYNIPKDLIEAEITETIVIEVMQQQNLQDALSRLKQKNIRLSIDDFGSGYSSLGVFERVPASVIKLDRSFLLNHTDRMRQVEIMRHIVSLAEALSAQIVCEGVENLQDVELMQEIGAYVAQGYYYAKPVPEDAFERRLQEQQLREISNF